MLFWSDRSIPSVVSLFYLLLTIFVSIPTFISMSFLFLFLFYFYFFFISMSFLQNIFFAVWFPALFRFLTISLTSNTCIRIFLTFLRIYIFHFHFHFLQVWFSSIIVMRHIQGNNKFLGILLGIALQLFDYKFHCF